MNSKLKTQNSKLLSIHLGALLLYTALAIVATWPLATFFTHGLIGNDKAVDSYQHTWHQWWVAEALTHGKSPFFTNLLYYPEGIDLFWQTLGFTQGLVAMPLTLTLGAIAGVNFTVLSSFVIGGYATFLLAKRLSESVAGALVAGSIYVLSPYHLQKMSEGSIELTSIHWLPVYVLALYVLLERPTWWKALLAGAALLWVSLGAWYYGLFAVMFTGCMSFVWALGSGMSGKSGESERVGKWESGRSQQNSKLNIQNSKLSSLFNIQRSTFNIKHSVQRFLWGLTPLLIWVLVLAPRISSVNQSIDQSSWDMRQAQVEHSADLIDFFLPSPLNPVWGPAIRDWRTARYPDLLTYWNVSLGLVGLLLALIGMATSWRKTWRWGLLLLATMLLAMGPMLRLAGQQTDIPLPFALIQGLPGIRIGQRPSHMAVLASLMIAVLASFGTARILAGRQRWVVIAASAALIIGILRIDGQIEPERMVMHVQPLHPWYRTLPAPDGALMPLPMYVNINRIDNMANQIVHKWPIFAGYVARPPAYSYAYYTDGVNQLRTGEAISDDIVSPGWPESGRRALAAERVRYVALDLRTMRGDPKLAAGKPEYFANVRQRLAELGVGAPLVADADLEAYAIPRDWPVLPTGSLGPGWLALERQANAGVRWRWMGAQSELWLFNPYEKPVSATIHMRLASFEQERELRVRLDSVEIGTWMVHPTPQHLNISILLPPGRHKLFLAADPAPDPASGGQRISVRAFELGFRFGASEQGTR